MLKNDKLYRNCFNEGSSTFLYNSDVSFNGSWICIKLCNYWSWLGSISNSYILMHEDISFTNSVARQRGGAIYVEDCTVFLEF